MAAPHASARGLTITGEVVLKVLGFGVLSFGFCGLGVWVLGFRVLAGWAIRLQYSKFHSGLSESLNPNPNPL